MAMKHEGIEGRTDVYRLNPKYIQVEEGWNPRKNFGDDADEELKNSIIENGVLVPLRVKKNGEEGFVLVDGERRLRAVKSAIQDGNDINVPAIIERKTMNEIDSMIVSLLANTGKPLSPTEEAIAFKKLNSWGMSVKDIAKKMGKSEPYVYDRFKLIDASPSLQEAIENKEVTLGSAKEIIEESQGSVEKQNEAVQEVKEGKRSKGGKKKEKKEEKGEQKETKESKYMKCNKEELYDLLNEAVDDYKRAEAEGDESFKQFAGGMIRATANVLEIADPVDLDH